jgi:hypothetical protein
VSLIYSVFNTSSSLRSPKEKNMLSTCMLYDAWPCSCGHTIEVVVVVLDDDVTNKHTGMLRTTVRLNRLDSTFAVHRQPR